MSRPGEIKIRKVKILSTKASLANKLSMENKIKIEATVKAINSVKNNIFFIPFPLNNIIT